MGPRSRDRGTLAAANVVGLGLRRRRHCQRPQVGDGHIVDPAGLLRGLPVSGGEVLQAEQRQFEECFQGAPQLVVPPGCAAALSMLPFDNIRSYVSVGVY